MHLNISSAKWQSFCLILNVLNPVVILNLYFDGLVQERRNSIANALELRLSCTNPSV